MKLLIAGGSGFIGTYLRQFLTEQGHTVFLLTRSTQKAESSSHSIVWDGTQLTTDEHFDAIINLCGQGIADKRWSNKVKDQLLTSRLQPTDALVTFIKNAMSSTKPRLINASAIGFYPSSNSQQTEDNYVSAADHLFSAQLVSKWEACARQATAYGAQVTTLRFGVVLGNGGMLAKMLPSFKLGAGAILGDNNAFLSWIHIEDLSRAIAQLLTVDQLQPAYNLTAPTPCTQREFAQTLARLLHRPCLLRLPSPIVKALFGQLGEELVLANQQIMPQRMLELGFNFKHPTITNALEAILRDRKF